METTNLHEVKEAIESGVDIIMLDNMSKDEMKDYIKSHPKDFTVEESRDIQFVSFNIKPTTEDEEIIKREEKSYDVGDQADLILKEARLEAEKIVFDAQKKFEGISQQKKHVETQLKEFIQVERDIIHKYETEDK